MKDEFFYLGTLTRPFGLKGELCAFFDTDNPERYTQLDALFLDLDGEKIPYTVEHIAYRGNNQFVIKFDGIGPNECREFAQVELYLPLSQLPPLDGNRFYFHEVVGFRVVDSQYGDIGTLEQVIEYPAQPLFQVMKNGTEILIPVIDEVIDNVDRTNKTIHITAPNGLIDLYIGDTNK